MKVIFDFLISALPWIAIGLFIACSSFYVLYRSVRLLVPAVICFVLGIINRKIDKRKENKNECEL